MAGSAPKPVTLHLAGIAMAVLLTVACYGLYVHVPGLVRGTFLQRIEYIVIFLGILALLTLAERLWVLVTAWLHPGPRD